MVGGTLKRVSWLSPQARVNPFSPNMSGVSLLANRGTFRLCLLKMRGRDILVCNTDLHDVVLELLDLRLPGRELGGQRQTAFRLVARVPKQRPPLTLALLTLGGQLLRRHLRVPHLQKSDRNTKSVKLCVRNGGK